MWERSTRNIDRGTETEREWGKPNVQLRVFYVNKIKLNALSVFFLFLYVFPSPSLLLSASPFLSLSASFPFSSLFLGFVSIWYWFRVANHVIDIIVHMRSAQPCHCKFISQLAVDKKVLLVFPKNDVVCATLNDACQRLEMDTFLSQTASETIEAFQHNSTGGHNLIIVDGRQPTSLDPETIAR